MSLHVRPVVLLLLASAAGVGCNPYETEAPADGSGGNGPSADKFSFFYTSLAAMKRLSTSEHGFGGDLRFETSSGLEGADKICQTIGTEANAGTKIWRAFLSATKGPDGRPVHAIERIGTGPWYDRKSRLIASDPAGLVNERPAGDATAVSDLPDETGEGTSALGTTYDAITGSNKLGMLKSDDPRNTCMDWTDRAIDNVQVTAGHSWLAGGIANWIDAHPERSCVPGVKLDSSGISDGTSIGAGGGWGGFYCFALSP